MRVLIVEDNARLAGLFARGIAEKGFAVDRARDLGHAEQALRSATYDAMVLDLGLPDGDGLEWLRANANTLDLPILVMTARDALGDRVAGLDAGADDYLVKPVDIAELAARLRALLRRPGYRNTPVMRIGDLQFDAAARTARNGERDIELTRREADLLELLMRRAGTVVNKTAITDALYSFEDPVTPNAIEAIVSRLRQHLLAAGAGDVLITIRGTGYMLRDQTR